MNGTGKVLLIRCKGCLCYAELPPRGSPFFVEELANFKHAHRLCPKKD